MEGTKMKLYTNECLYKDVYTIIEMMSPEMRNRINEDFIEFLRDNQDVEFEGTVNPEVPIKNQNLKEEIKIMLSLMYISFFCEEEEKKEILELDEINVKKFYNRDIFSDKEENFKEQFVEERKEEMALVEYKESFITRILNKIKSWFGR